MNEEIKPRYYNGVPYCGCSACPMFSPRVKGDGTLYRRGGGWCKIDPIGSVMRSNSACYPTAQADREELLQLRKQVATAGSGK